MYIPRILTERIRRSLENHPVTAIIGARQVGKSTLARHLTEAFHRNIYLDLERPSDSVLLSEAEDFFMLHKDKIICLDEIQLRPGLFPIIRSIVDDPSFTGRFLILGSASPDLLRQSSETLAGRIAYFELPPFVWKEVQGQCDWQTYHFRGGFPRALLSSDDEASLEWLENFTTTFLERDLSSFGFHLPSATLNRLWKMLAHLHGQLINFSQLANALGLSHNTVRHYTDVLHKTFMLRFLPPWHANSKKRLVKRPKVYIRDAGILHSLLRIQNYEELFAHPVFGYSYEGLIIENLLQKFPGRDAFFYRTSSGSEIDLLLVRGKETLAFEIKASSSPTLSRSFWHALEEVQPDQTFVIAPVKQAFRMKSGVEVVDMGFLL